MTLKVLLIEDSESDAGLNLRALEEAGFVISGTVVSTASEMQSALTDQTFDIILSDHNLPQFNAGDALEIVKKHGLDIPFIVVSGAIGEETAVSLMKSGAQDYVMKSNLKRLALVVARELQEAEIRRQRKHLEVRLGDLYQQEKVYRKKLQEEARVKDLFIDVLAHELRNSMTSILVSSDILKDSKPIREDLRDRLVANINDGARLVNRRLDELLDLAWYSKGTFSIHRQTVDGQEFIREVAARFTPNLLLRAQNLKLEIDSELHNINIDTSRLEQVIINLLSNASKYSPENSEIRLKAGIREQGFVLEVSDNGIGISPEDQEKIFQPYYRACKDRKIDGIGLGMAVSHNIIEAHGGQIGVTSQLGQGSTFNFYIPEAVVS